MPLSDLSTPGSKGIIPPLGLARTLHMGGGDRCTSMSPAELFQLFSIFLHFCFCSAQCEGHVKGRSKHFFLKWMLAQKGVGINVFLSRNSRRRRLNAIDVELTQPATYFSFFDLLPWFSHLKVLIKALAWKIWHPYRHPRASAALVVL